MCKKTLKCFLCCLCCDDAGAGGTRAECKGHRFLKGVALGTCLDPTHVLGVSVLCLEVTVL